jgi:hypothetical protein
MSARKDYESFFEELLGNIRSAVKNKTAASDLCELVERSDISIYGEYLGLCSLVSVSYAENPDGGLDRHKRGACLTVAFMTKLVIPPDKGRYEAYREKLALVAGLKAMGVILESESRGDSAMVAWLIKNEGFVLPDPICGQDTYAKSWAFRLRHAVKKDVNLGILALGLASELFLIESYNRALLKQL